MKPTFHYMKGEIMKEEDSMNKECWDLDYALATWLSPRLKLFINNLNSHPSNFTHDEWCEILKTIESGVSTYIDENTSFHDMDAKLKYQEALKLLSENIFHMWD